MIVGASRQYIDRAWKALGHSVTIATQGLTLTGKPEVFNERGKTASSLPYFSLRTLPRLVCNFWFVACSSSLLFVVCCSLFDVCCVVFVVGCVPILLFVVCCLLFVALWSLFDACCLLFVVCCLLFAV